ncbi:MAG TPA: beta-galactosidase GalA [Flavisolibacter sp.]|jgi:beta-galactosidase|nr:beta-galactosidase GalA [Flavisolibacter sp.]
MKRVFLILFLVFATFLVFAQQVKKREKLLMDFGWHFAFGHPFDTKKDFNHGTAYFSYLAKAGYGDGPAAANFDDRAWRKLDLPHDWAVEQPFSANASYSHGFKAIGRNFPEASVGWYRKKFFIPQLDTGRKISVVFDGVFRNSIVWVNGHYLGTEESGYNGFQYDISDVLNYGGDNVIAVRVDATMEEGWFYEGAGIYRHVWLTKTNPVHVKRNGTFITSEIKGSNAIVTAKAEIVNEDNKIKTIDLLQAIIDTDGKTVASKRISNVQIAPFETRDLTSSLNVENPKLWGLQSPYLYKIVTSVIERNNELDSYETTLGIRTIRFDAKEGFFLNGKHLKLKGTNNHQDHAGVGAAMPDELIYWRIKTLKEIGSNAYRCSHNPPAHELLDACDRLGMLVLDENRLMRTTEDGLNEMKRMIIRDRNHPCIIAWSIGNEEWGIENNITGERIANTLQNFAKSLDSTRPTTAGISGGFRSGISDVLEVMGYNYLGNGDIEAHHKNFPDQPAMGTEEGSTFATRGIYITDDSRHYHAAYDQKPRPTFYSIEEGWKFYAARPYLAGIFIWTGFDYRGEPTPYGWPSVTSYFGMMDLCGFPKDNVYYLKSWWSDKPTLHILPHWNWKGKEGKAIDVWVHSNCDEVELFLNKKSLGKKKMELNSHLEWKVNYAPGILQAVGYKIGKKLLTDIVNTTDDAASIQLDAGKFSLAADGEDVSIITVKALDKNKLAVPVAGNEITFRIDGPAKIIGIGNGDPTSSENEKYLETIQTILIEDLKEKQVAGMDVTNELAADIDDASWVGAFKNRDYKNLAKAYVYRGSFTLPESFSNTVITLFYKNIGLEQTIYVNGKAIASNLKQNETANGFVIDKSILKAGKNLIAILATPIPKKYDWENVNTDPGLIQIVTAAQPWKRKLFNGLAQVIVQTTKEAGKIVLTATSPGLQPTTIKLQSNKVVPRPSID